MFCLWVELGDGICLLLCLYGGLGWGPLPDSSPVVLRCLWNSGETLWSVTGLSAKTEISGHAFCTRILTSQQRNNLLRSTFYNEI